MKKTKIVQKFIYQMQKHDETQEHFEVQLATGIPINHKSLANTARVCVTNK